MKAHHGALDGKGKKFGIVASRFNDFITSHLLAGAEDRFRRLGVADDDVEVYWVPGSFEIPIAAKRLAESGKYDGVVCLGAVIRGQTPHSEYIAAEVAKGVAAVAMSTGVPTIFGILTPDTLEQAIERAGTKAGNKGAQAAEAAVEMANLFE